MLGDVYGEPKTKPATAPEWADEERLDEAFEDWTPGPSPDASAAERRFFGARRDDDSEPLADDLASALSEAVLAEGDEDEGDDEVTEAGVAEVHEAETDDETEQRPAPVPYQPRKSAFDFSAASNDEDLYRAMAILRHDEEVEEARMAAGEPVAPIAPIEEPAPLPVVEPAELEPMAVAGPWQRDHDNILPRRSKAGGLQLSLRRR